MSVTNSGAAALGSNANTRMDPDGVLLFSPLQENQADSSQPFWLLLFCLWGSGWLGQIGIYRRHSPGGGLAKSGDRFG